MDTDTKSSLQDMPIGAEVASGELFCKTTKELTAATGLTDWQIRRIRRHARLFPDDNPFRGRGAFPTWLRAYVRKHRDCFGQQFYGMEAEILLRAHQARTKRGRYAQPAPPA